ncbi:MAG: helix-turn-helix transcriptional regulator [Oscillospiraceae bacterium]|nr:helix-turn-helix transcriptional regulator [Oscillospiraceae bacterium]
MDIMDIFDRFDYSLSHLAFIRKKKGISQQELGDFLGVSQSTISSWENGGYSDLDLKIIKKLVDYFSVPSWFF